MTGLSAGGAMNTDRKSGSGSGRQLRKGKKERKGKGKGGGKRAVGGGKSSLTTKGTKVFTKGTKGVKIECVELACRLWGCHALHNSRRPKAATELR
jgi:hypothetical protein